jgi:hypothetical protein
MRTSIRKFGLAARKDSSLAESKLPADVPAAGSNSGGNQITRVIFPERSLSTGREVGWRMGMLEGVAVRPGG